MRCGPAVGRRNAGNARIPRRQASAPGAHDETRAGRAAARILGESPPPTASPCSCSEEDPVGDARPADDLGSRRAMAALAEDSVRRIENGLGTDAWVRPRMTYRVTTTTIACQGPADGAAARVAIDAIRTTICVSAGRTNAILASSNCIPRCPIESDL